MAPSTSTPRPFEKRAADYGCTEMIRLDQKLSVPAQLNYLDLLPTRANQTATITAVAEHQSTALLYLVDGCGDTRADGKTLGDLRRQLANRSDPAWLGVVQLGSLEIYPIGFHESADDQPIKTIEKQNANSPLFFQSLVHGTFEENSRLRGTDYVYKKIFALLTQTTNAFVPADGNGQIDALEVLSMAGRALFFRFLIDRRIVRPSEISGPEGICPAATELKDAFSSAEKAAQTSAWLDATFNGDFLPLVNESIPNEDRPKREKAYLAFFRKTERHVGKSIFAHLHAILRGWQSAGDVFQMEFDWDELEVDWGDLDFAHIPVGVLSQVYESFSHRADPRTATDTSVHYTPRTIASLMVDEAFAAVKAPGKAKVLDSACGAGIFLVLAFRRLVRERWTGDERPKTKEIQDVLYNQIRGFDISESALRLAALSLYITAIELNATQRPPKALKFPRNLRDEVLYRFGEGEEETDVMPLGSLGPEVSSNFDNQFDIVIGNPPWTRLRDRTDDGGAQREERKKRIATLNGEFTKIGRRVLDSRGVDLPKPYENPDNNPDLPFLWRAIEWAKPNAVIALAMPARLFGRSSGPGANAWNAVVKSIALTGLINGAELRKTQVSEGIDMPFCLIFARNGIPQPTHRFHYATPTFERCLNRDGRFRIDYEAANAISVDQVQRQPWLLKTLSLGTWLDVDLMSMLLASQQKSLSARWAEWDPSGDQTGQGFNRSPKLRQTYVDFLAQLPVFEKPVGDSFEIEHSTLQTYGQLYGTDERGWTSAYRPKTWKNYQPPLVILPKAPGDEPDRPKAYLSNEPLAFSQTFYGYSCAGIPDSEALAGLVFLLAHSTLFRYFSLMVSVSQGADHMIFTKQDFDSLPFPDVSSLSNRTKSKIKTLKSQLLQSSKIARQKIDEFVFELYGLNAADVQVARDTMFSAASYRKAGKEAFLKTSFASRSEFVGAIKDSLEPYFDICGEHVAVREAEFQPNGWEEPWFFLSISCETEQVNVNPALMRKAMEAANKRGCSRIIVNAPQRKGILLGLLNQRRWWTITRARLCAQHIIRERLAACGLPEDA